MWKKRTFGKEGWEVVLRINNAEVDEVVKEKEEGVMWGIGQNGKVMTKTVGMLRAKVEGDKECQVMLMPVQKDGAKKLQGKAVAKEMLKKLSVSPILVSRRFGATGEMQQGLVALLKDSEEVRMAIGGTFKVPVASTGTTIDIVVHPFH